MSIILHTDFSFHSKLNWLVQVKNASSLLSCRNLWTN